MWTIEYDQKAAEELAKLDRQSARRIKKYLDERIAPCDDPRKFGEGLKANLSGLWRYRVGDFRIIAEIQDRRVVVLVVRIGHRSRVYDRVK